MLPKRLFFSILLLPAFLLTGCATTGKSEIDPEKQYSYAHDTCVRFGFRRTTYDYIRCMEKQLGAEQFKFLYKQKNEASLKVASEKGPAGDSQDIICRRITVTGSRLKRKVCQSRAQWAYEDKKKQRAVDEFAQEFDKGTRTNASTGMDEMGGQSGGMPH